MGKGYQLSEQEKGLILAEEENDKQQRTEKDKHVPSSFRNY